MKGLDFYASRPDKVYSLVDRISMHTMRQMGLTEVLTNDHHFTQEGFTIPSTVGNSRHARQKCPRNLWPIAVRKLDQPDSAVSLDDLRIPPGNQLEALGGTGAVNSAFASTSGTASALSGRRGDGAKWKLLTITNWETLYTLFE